MVSPKLQIDVEPVMEGFVRYLPLAPTTPGGKGQAKLVVRLLITNKEGATVEVSAIRFAFPGSSLGRITMKRPDRVLKDGPKLSAGQAKWWSNGVVVLEDDSREYNGVFLPPPFPGQLRIEVSCAGFGDPATVSLPLSAHTTHYRFPYSASDFRVGEVFVTSARHWSNGGPPGGQIFAHDIGVQRCDPKEGWTEVKPGTKGNQNDDYLIYGKPLRAMADGAVASWHDGMADNTKLKELPKPKPEPGGGNHVWIRHGTDLVVYAHLQNGSIPGPLKKEGAPVKAGQIIGRVGNTGNSSNPHTHIECVEDSSTRPLRPFAFVHAWVAPRDKVTPPDPNGPWVELKGQGIPDAETAIWPAPTRPTWYPPGWGEIMRFGLPASRYQAEFNRATSSGYRPVWIDGYEVDGATNFNVIFRPARGVTWSARHGMSGSDYQAEFSKQKNAGYRPLNVSAYLESGSVRYAAIFVQAPGPAYRAYHGLGRDEHQANFNAWTREGYVPRNLSCVVKNGDRLITALYEKTDVGRFWARTTLSLDQYQDAWNDKTKAGLTLAYVSAYQTEEGVRLSAIYQEKALGTGGAIGRHNMTSEQLQAQFDERLRAGLLTRCIAGYERDGDARFAAVWHAP